MKRRKEKNIQEFNNDINATGQYLYTNFQKYSAYIATKRQTDELIKLIQANFGKDITVLDVGCGDGIFTIELFKAINPHKIIGFDRAKAAVRAANNKIKFKDKRKVVFRYGDVYRANKIFKKNSFDIVVVRGLLHHLYDPKKAIKVLSHLSKRIIVLEPNGFSPMLKIIEKISPYHRRHEEKSYWPPTLNGWFINENFKVKKQIFFSIVPYFCPVIFAKMLKIIEPIIEKIPFVKQLSCGTNLVYYEKII